MRSKNNHLNGVGKAGKRNPTVAFTPETYFRQLGLKPMSKKEIKKACRRLGKPELIKALQEATWKGDADRVRQILSEDLPLFKLIHCDYWPSILEKADLDARVPIRPQSLILVVGMGQAMIMAFGKAACHDSEVTCLNNYYSIGTQWAQEVGENRIKFADLTLPSLIDLSGIRFDVLFLSPGWQAILGRDTDSMTIPKMQKANGPDNEIPENRCEDVQLLNFFEIVHDAVSQEGILAIEYPCSAYDFGKLVNEMDVFGVFPFWRLVLAVSDFKKTDHTLIFSRCLTPAFAQEAFQAFADKGELVPGRTYCGEVALLFREFFKGSSPVQNLKLVQNGVESQIKFFEKGDVGLIYKTSSLGGRIAHPVTQAQFKEEGKKLVDFVKLREKLGKLESQW